MTAFTQAPPTPRDPLAKIQWVYEGDDIVIRIRRDTYGLVMLSTEFMQGWMLPTWCFKDGVRIETPKAWVHPRPIETEPQAR